MTLFILIETQWNLKYTLNAIPVTKDGNINRNTVEFKVVPKLVKKLKKYDINRNTVEFKVTTAPCDIVGKGNINRNTVEFKAFSGV